MQALQSQPRPVEAYGEDVELDVGRLHMGPRAGEDAHLARTDRHRACTFEDIFRADGQLAPPGLQRVVQRDRLVRAVIHADLKVVLQILADARQFMPHLNPGLLQSPAWTYA